MDEQSVKRVQSILATKGVKIDTDTLRDAIAVAEAPLEPAIAVSQRMIAAGRKAWLLNSIGPVHLLLAMLYRAMDQERIDEALELARIQAQPAEQPIGEDNGR